MTETVLLPATLQSALRALSDLRLEMAEDVEIRRARQAVIDASHRLEAAQSAAEKLELPFQARLAEIEEYIRGQVLEHGKSCEHAGVCVSYRAGYSRATWDDKRLSRLRAMPEVWAAISGARRVTDVAPSIRIE